MLVEAQRRVTRSAVVSPIIANTGHPARAKTDIPFQNKKHSIWPSSYEKDDTSCVCFFCFSEIQPTPFAGKDLIY